MPWKVLERTWHLRGLRPGGVLLQSSRPHLLCARVSFADLLIPRAVRPPLTPSRCPPRWLSHTSRFRGSVKKEVQRGQVTCPRAHSQEAAELAANLPSECQGGDRLEVQGGDWCQPALLCCRQRSWPRVSRPSGHLRTALPLGAEGPPPTPSSGVDPSGRGVSPSSWPTLAGGPGRLRHLW